MTRDDFKPGDMILDNQDGDVGVVVLLDRIKEDEYTWDVVLDVYWNRYGLCSDNIGYFYDEEKYTLLKKVK